MDVSCERRLTCVCMHFVRSEMEKLMWLASSSLLQNVYRIEYTTCKSPRCFVGITILRIEGHVVEAVVALVSSMKYNIAKLYHTWRYTPLSCENDGLRWTRRKLLTVSTRRSGRITILMILFFLADV